MGMQSKSPMQNAARALLAACAVFASTAPSPAAAQPVFKCGKTYTNVSPTQGPQQLRARGCTLVDTTDRTREPIAIDGSNQITIPVGKDGRFWVRGSVNGFPVQFMIDNGATNASGVAVSEEFASHANLIGGNPAFIQTAGGSVATRRLDRVPLTIGPFRLPQATVFVGAVSSRADEAILGRSVLEFFDVAADDTKMTIKSRTKQAP